MNLKLTILISILLFTYKAFFPLHAALMGLVTKVNKKKKPHSFQ